MGSFIGYQGSYKIPEGKQALFAEQMCRVLDLGGMMNLGTVQMFDQTLMLLKPVREMKEKEICFYYNYFEDDAWESAGFDREKTCLWSGKVGNSEFSDTMMAAYMLYELYDPEYGLVRKDCYFAEASLTIGWLNQILGTQFSIGKRRNLWACIEQDVISESRDEIDRSVLTELMPYGWRSAAGGTDLADLMYIIYGTEHLVKKAVSDGTYPSDILKCKQELLTFFQKDPDREELWNLLKKNYKEREQEKREDLLQLAKWTLQMPARVFVYLTAEIWEENFWKLWSDLSAEVYHDERMKTYASAELTEWREHELQEPVRAVRTSVFLRQDNYFTFFDTPKELKGTPNFYLSDADRLYWWDGSDEVRITEETDAWLKEMVARHREIMKSINPAESSSSGLCSFILLLSEINEYYWNIFPFESMFYDFIEHISQKAYAAAIELIRQIADAEENRKAGKVIRNFEHRAIRSKNVTGNRGRIQVKRIYAVFANKQLRMKYFDF